ncbi:MAG: FprA family A-type flavoprotein [Muribaculaceae bacterium]|nr:FprA family A-type flavoprotein [Muribaculaceae bacterium]
MYKISPDIFYIGVNDRVTSLFEGLWPLPTGITYNSYLVRGSEKTAIIDGVELGHAAHQIQRIKELLGDKAPDYLVINHMEPDHSGAIELLRREFPDIIIVGNSITHRMLEGFFGPVSNTMTIKDGQSLSLGNLTLTFFLTPLVHWPETMMTYVNERNTIFSGDAFGCFGALNGAVVDTDMNPDRYFPEMVRYYSNIVGKYGVHVQRALKKLSAIKIDTICSTHGPVWRANVDKVIDIYDKLSRYEPLDEGVTIVYGSMYGNTTRIAETVAAALVEDGIRDIDIHDATYTHLSYILADIFRHRGLVIASPTYSEAVFPPIQALLEALQVRGLKERHTMVVGSYTWASKAGARITDILTGCGLQPITETITLRQTPTPEGLEQCRHAAHTLSSLLKS